MNAHDHNTTLKAVKIITFFLHKYTFFMNRVGNGISELVVTERLTQKKKTASVRLNLGITVSWGISAFI